MLDDYTFQELVALANSKNTSIGHLVRTAVKHTYFSPSEKVLARRKKAYQKLLAWQEKIGTSPRIDYKSLILDGRTR